ncbi:MAG TPA: TonB-dependent receptor plug domain-containing protein, partial [Phenylobacterium sp.]
MLIWALAQAAAVVAAPADQPGVVSYPPAFFAAQNPGSALDMIGRLPSFSLDTGANVRGFEGAAGNVLINGQRPSSKADGLDTILQRIPAGKVERIDVIRGGAPGIDMQGKTVIANVILKSGGGTRGLLEGKDYRLTDGRSYAGGRAEASGSFGDTTWEVGLRGDAGPDNTVSPGGRGLVIFADGRPTQVQRLDSTGYDASGSATGAAETSLFGGRLRVNGRLYRERFGEPETDTVLSPAPEVLAFHYAQKTTDTEIGGRFSRKF